MGPAVLTGGSVAVAVESVGEGLIVGVEGGRVEAMPGVGVPGIGSTLSGVMLGDGVMLGRGVREGVR
jgi:hypothetical protein